MRKFGVLGVLAAVLVGLSGSGPAAPQPVVGPSVGVAGAAPVTSAAAAGATSTTPAASASPAVWQSYAWRPWSQYDRSLAWGDRGGARRAYRWQTERPWQWENRDGRRQTWQDPQRYGWRYGWRADRPRSPWGNNAWDQRAWRGEPWRREFRGPWAGDRRWVNSGEDSWRYYRR